MLATITARTYAVALEFHDHRKWTRRQQSHFMRGRSGSDNPNYKAQRRSQ